MSLARVSREPERLGVLLVIDVKLPSVTRIVAGETLKGSWWSHPKACAIYAVLEALEGRFGNRTESPRPNGAWATSYTPDNATTST